VTVRMRVRVRVRVRALLVFLDVSQPLLLKLGLVGIIGGVGVRGAGAG
jgi:hypothetical protein